MFKSYLKIAFRNLKSHKMISGINLLGLSIGFIGCILILNYVYFELSFDKYHSDSDRIYRVVSENINEGGQGSALTPPPLALELSRNFPEVSKATRMILPWSGKAATSTLNALEDLDKPVRQSFQWGFFVDPDFLEIFDFELIVGDSRTALEGINKIILTPSSAEKLFGNDWKQKNVIGKTVEYINEFDRFNLVISGIIQDSPSNSHFKYDFLASFSTLNTGWAKDYVETWNGNLVYSYLKLNEGSDPQIFNNHIQSFVKESAPLEIRESKEYHLQSIEDIHLRSNLEEELGVNGNITNIYFLIALVGLILLIALGNFINLTISSSIPRANEVGVRKVMGAIKSQLIWQFLLESSIMVLISLGMAILGVYLFKPYYFQVLGLDFDLLTLVPWKTLVLITPIFILLSGFYPAFLLSGFSPISMLKGKMKYSRSGKSLRSGLVVFQFVLSIVLVVFTSVLLKQVFFMQSTNPGFSKEGVLVLQGPTARTETWVEHDQKKQSIENEGDLLKDKLGQSSMISEVSLSWSLPGTGLKPSEITLNDEFQNKVLDFIVADDDYASVYNLQILAGRFSVDNGIVINEKAVELLGFESPQSAVGERFLNQRGNSYQINGVIKDYYHFGYKQEIQPLAITKNDPSYKLDSYYSIKLNQSSLAALLPEIQKDYEEVFPGNSFEYFFIDSFFEKQYLSEKNFGTVFTIFSILAIFISCLGLFAISVQSTLEKTKEIGIRKVLGANESEILISMMKSTVLLIVAAVFIAVPISYVLSKNWLKDYAYRIDLTFDLFLIGPIIILLLGLASVGYQSIRAATTNPVKSLRSE